MRRARIVTIMETGGTKKDPDERITIKVVSQNGTEVFFQIKNTTRMQKMFDAYCTRMGCAKDSVRFLYEGLRVQPESTPASLGLKNDDIIDAMLSQTGG